jgi:purine-nucleoside phosphorylase
MKLAATLHERIQAAARAAAEHIDARGADVAVVLGSGLHGVGSRLMASREIAYAALPGFPETTVAGHPGRLMAGQVAQRKTLLLCGRVHGYEGYSACEVGFGVRVAAALGVGTLIVTNASGGIDPVFHPGEIVVLSDHINLTGATPLTGPNDERLGPRFVDMTDAYTPSLRALAVATAGRGQSQPLREAVYAGMAGPSYETPAEVRMLRVLGAGVVGMSTVHEVIAARHAGLAILGLSLVANHAAGVSREPLRHEDVTRAAAAGSEALADLVTGVIAALPPRKSA